MWNIPCNIWDIVIRTLKLLDVYLNSNLSNPTWSGKEDREA